MDGFNPVEGRIKKARSKDIPILKSSWIDECITQNKLVDVTADVDLKAFQSKLNAQNEQHQQDLMRMQQEWSDRFNALLNPSNNTNNLNSTTTTTFNFQKFHKNLHSELVTINFFFF